MEASGTNASTSLVEGTNALEFDDETLRAIAEVYKTEGNYEFGRKEFNNAIYFYTEGIRVNCKDDDLNAKIYNNRATVHFHLGNYLESLSDTKASLKLQPNYIQAIDQEMGECKRKHMYTNLDMLQYFESVIECLIYILEIDKVKKNRAGEGKTYRILGRVYDVLGLFEKAINCYEISLKIAEEIGNRPDEGFVCSNLGNIYYCLGDFKKAIDYQHRRVEIAKEIEDKVEEGGTYGDLATIYERLGDFIKAVDYHKLSLDVAKEDGNKATEGIAYGKLGNDYHSLGDFKKAIDFHERCLNIAKDVGDRTTEGRACTNLGNAYHSVGDFKTAINYHKLCLQITTGVGDRTTEAAAYTNLGNAYLGVGDFKTAIHYHELCLNIAKDMRDRTTEGTVYTNLGNAYQSLGNFEKAINYHQHGLIIAREVGDRAGEGKTCGNLGNDYLFVGNFEESIEYQNLHLNIAKEVGDQAGRGSAYWNLGRAYQCLGDNEKSRQFDTLAMKIAKEVGNKPGEGHGYGALGEASLLLGDFNGAIHHYKRRLEISKELGDKSEEAKAYLSLGRCLESSGSLLEAIDCYQESVRILNDVRVRLQDKDEWKISLCHLYQFVYVDLWCALLKQGKVVEALIAADQGRAQALNDLMEIKYGYETSSNESAALEGKTYAMISSVSANTVFASFCGHEVILWVSQRSKGLELRRKPVSDNRWPVDATTFFQSSVDIARKEIGVRSYVKCEDRSLEKSENDMFDQVVASSSLNTPLNSALGKLYDAVICPIEDLLDCNEIIFVTEGPLCLAPFAALVDSNSKYLSESFRIRMIPSLTSLRLIEDSPADYHYKTGALLVGDPWVQEYTYKGRKLVQLPCAREEVEMIGRILNTEPLTGTEATKDAVLERLSSVALVHIAAHGRMETGEIALAPNPARASQTPTEEDFLLTMKDVSSVQIRARLVVLSCCHSGRGEIKAEGVVGIARAFLGAGARSVLVSLWAIDDEATLEFMKSFYQHLAEGRSASEALNRAMKCMRESDKFSKVKYWAPFVLIGDDVTLEFGTRE